MISSTTIKQLYEDYRFPPYIYLKAVLQHCPKAGLLYMQLWDLADEERSFILKRSEIQSTFLTTQCKFKNDLSLLAREALLHIHETSSTFKIELVGWDDDDDQA